MIAFKQNQKSMCSYLGEERAFSSPMNKKIAEKKEKGKMIVESCFHPPQNGEKNGGGCQL